MYQIVVSSANSLYMAWQTQVLCASAWTTLRQRPTVVVHASDGTKGSEEPLCPEFRLLQEHGYRVIQVPSYARTPTGLLYPPRNELGTLCTLASMRDLGAEPVLFCEPDMLFVRPLDYRGGLAAEFYTYLHYEEPRVANAARACGIGHRIATLNATRRIGVPYLLPADLIGRLASRWIAVLDAFDELRWIDIMYAFGIAVELEQLDVQVTHMMTDNYHPMKPVRRLVHYCYGDAIFDKRRFRQQSPLDLRDEDLPAGVPDTVLGEIVRQVRQARELFRPNGAR